MKRIRWFLFPLALALCSLGTAWAAEAEFDGYLALIDTDMPVSLLSAEGADFPEMTEVYAPEGVYQVEDADALDALRERGLLLHAEPNYIVTLDDMPALPDMTFDEEAVLLTAAENQWFTSQLEIEWAWGKGIRGSGVRVGVVDSGIYKGHREFEGVKILDGANYCVGANDSARKNVSDTYGHGTFVSGLIAASENGIGVVGISPEVELVPLKCFEGKNGSVANIAAAIYDAVDTWHCQVLNLSLGLEQDSSILRKAVEYAGKAGVVMVAAAGNLLNGSHKTGGDPLNYPAAYPDVIGVGAVDSKLSVASFSYRNQSVEICAPGQNLRGLSTLAATSYVSGYGTSYASPMVAAAAALALSARPSLTPAELRDLLTSTARDLGTPGYDTSYGHGLLQIGYLCAMVTGDLLYQTELFRARLTSADGPTQGLFAAAYDADGALLAVRDVSPLIDLEHEPNTLPLLSAVADPLSEETFQVPNAVLWKLFPFNRSTFTPAGASETLYNGKR